MTSTQIDINNVKASLSQRMIDKFECVCQAYIKELLILKKDEEEKGNVEQYSWLNIAEYQPEYMTTPIQGLTEQMFVPRIEPDKIRWSIISNNFIPEDVPILKNFSNNYYIHMYNYTQEKCEQSWKRRMLDYRNNLLEYSNMVCELAMYLYMDLNENFVIDNLNYNPDTNKAQLK